MEKSEPRFEVDPYFGDGAYFVTLAQIRAALAKAGLSIAGEGTEGARIAQLEAEKLGALQLVSTCQARMGELEAQCAATEASASTVYAISRQRIATLEAKETARNAARLAELASGTVSRTEYEAMVQQRDTIRQERKEAMDRASTLRGILGDVLADLVKLRKDPAQLWLLDEAMAAADLDGSKYNCDSPDYVGEARAPAAHCSACEDYPTLGLLECTICGRTGEDQPV